MTFSNLSPQNQPLISWYILNQSAMKLGTVWGVRLWKMLCKKFSQRSPCLLGQHGRSSTAQRPVELSDKILQNIFPNLTSQTSLEAHITWKRSWQTCPTNPELVVARVHRTLDDRGDRRFRRTVPRSRCRRRETAHRAVTRRWGGLSIVRKHVQTSKCIIYHYITHLMQRINYRSYFES